MFNHRIPDLLEALKNEFDSLAHDVKVYKLQRDEYERTLQMQLGELSNIQNSLYDLERRHSSLQKKYEEEITRARSKELNTAEKTSPSNRFQSLLSGQNLLHMPENKTPILPSLSLNNNNLSSNNINSINNLNRPLTTSNETPSAFKLGSLNLPPSVNNNSNNIHNIMNNSPPNNSFNGNHSPLSNSGGSNPILFDKLKAQQATSEQTLLSGTKRKEFSPEKTFPSIHSTDQPTKYVKKEVEEFRPLHLHPPSLDEMKDSRQVDHFNFPKPTLNIPSFPAPSFPPNGGNFNEFSHNSEEKMRVHNQRGGIDVEMSKEILHKSAVCCVKFSKDGKYLATGSKKKAQIFNVSDGKKHKAFSNFERVVEMYLRSVCFSPDGRYLACGGEDKAIVVWDIEDNKTYQTLEGHSMDIYSLDYSPDGAFLASGSGDKTVKIWDLSQKKCTITLGENDIAGGPKDGVTSVVFSPDRRTIAAGSLDRVVRIWDVETGTQTSKFEGHLDSVYSVSFSVDGKTLASGSLDKTLKLWDTDRSSGCRSTLIGHNDFVLSVGFTPDDRWLISGSKDRTVQFWDPKTSTSHCKLEGHKNSVISIAINPTSPKFATGSGDNKAKIWDYKIADEMNTHS